jgi:hypothetical protein
MKLLIRADFGAFKGNILKNTADRFAIQMFIEINVTTNPMSLLCTVSGDLMYNGGLFRESVENAGVMGNVVFPFQIQF